MAKKIQKKHPWLNRSDERNPLFLAFFGVNGTGKSTLMKSFLSMNKRNIILPSNMIDARKTWDNYPVVEPKFQYIPDVFDPKGKGKILEWSIPNVQKFSGTKLMNVGVFRTGEHKRSFFESISDTNSPKCYRDGALFCDDTKNYIITKGDLPNRVASWLIARRHIQMDIFLAFHSFQDINAQMLQYGCKFFIFKTDLPPYGSVKEKIQCWDDLVEMRDYVNKRALTNPHYFEAFDPVNSEANEIFRQQFRKK